MGIKFRLKWEQQLVWYHEVAQWLRDKLLQTVPDVHYLYDFDVCQSAENPERKV